MPPEDTSGLDPKKALGLAVRTLRKERGLAREDLAQRASLSPNWLAHLESGDQDPTWGDMRHLAKGLDVSLEKLTEVAEEIEEGRIPG